MKTFLLDSFLALTWPAPWLIFSSGLHCYKLHDSASVVVVVVVQSIYIPYRVSVFELVLLVPSVYFQLFFWFRPLSGCLWIWLRLGFDPCFEAMWGLEIPEIIKKKNFAITLYHLCTLDPGTHSISKHTRLSRCVNIFGYWPAGHWQQCFCVLMRIGKTLTLGVYDGPEGGVSTTPICDWSPSGCRVNNEWE